MGAAEPLAMIVGILTAVSMIFALLGLGVRFVLLPYLKSELVKPVQETHKAVTVNGGKSDPPTLLDKVSQLQTEVQGIGSQLDEHIRWHLHDHTTRRRT